MIQDLLYVLLSLAVLFIPLGFAWFVLSRTARRHPHVHPKADRPED